MVVHIRVEEDSLDSNKLRALIETMGCGSIVSFVGLTRGNYQDKKVKSLEFDSWEAKLPEVLEKIANDAITKISSQISSYSSQDRFSRAQSGDSLYPCRF